MNKRLFTLLKRAFTKLGLIANYVVEEGTSGIWEYTKWSNGRVELQGTESKDGLAVSIAYGSYYYGRASSPQFPFEITGARAWVSLGAAGVDFAAKVRVDSDNQKISYAWANGSPYSSGQPLYSSSVDYYVTGYWKTPTWGGQYLVRLLKGGVRHAAVSPVKECNPRAKEHLFPHDRWEHARRWLCGLSERLQGVLGTALQFQKWRYVYRTGIVWKWRCDDNSYLQLRYYGSMYFPWKRIRENCLYGGVGHAYQCRINGKHAIRLVSRSRAITHAGGDSYAAV